MRRSCDVTRCGQVTVGGRWSNALVVCCQTTKTIWTLISYWWTLDVQRTRSVFVQSPASASATITEIISTQQLNSIFTWVLTYLLCRSWWNTVREYFSPVLSPSSYLQLYMKPDVHIYFSKSLFHVFFGFPISPWSCGVHLFGNIILSSFLLSVCSSKFYFFFSTGPPSYALVLGSLVSSLRLTSFLPTLWLSLGYFWPWLHVKSTNRKH